jgi:hypothetical protein
MATYPAAVRWNLATQDYDLNATTGAHVEAHPVDAAVVCRIGFRQGSISGDATSGHTLHLLPTVQNDEQRSRDIWERQTKSLGSLITDGSVEIVSIEEEFTVEGRLSVQTTYRNLATGETGTVTSG